MISFFLEIKNSYHPTYKSVIFRVCDGMGGGRSNKMVCEDSLVGKDEENKKAKNKKACNDVTTYFIEV